MNLSNIKYLCTTIGNLSGVPIRIFQGESLFYYYSQSELPRDPMTVYRKNIFDVHDHIGYITTRFFHYYGIVNSGDIKIVIGPTRQVGENDQELRELAFQADVPSEGTEAFINGMKLIGRMPFESILQMLCAVNFVLNDEKLFLSDITIYNADQERLISQYRHMEAEYKLSFPAGELPNQHNTFDYEQQIIHLIRRGNTDALRDLFASAPVLQSGMLSGNQLRQWKNTFIVSATLASRAAIQGGMPVSDAFTLSDFYIQQCELLSFPEDIINLSYRMMLDYARHIEHLHLGIKKQPSKLVLDVVNYIWHHMSEAITVEQTAKELFLSRPYLSRRFKAETGENLTDYILKTKTEEAKRLLRYSDKSLSAISSYLGFSSPSHFTRVFRKYASVNPGEYRSRYLRDPQQDVSD